MADITTVKLLTPRPLVTGDAGGLKASVDPRGYFQPTMLLETDVSTGTTVSTSGLAADGDVWDIRFAPPSAIPNVVFYPIALRMSIVASGEPAGFDAQFADEGMYSITPPYGADWGWDNFSLENVGLIWQGSQLNKVRSGNPVWKAFPPRPQILSSDTVSENALGGIQITIGTWNATAAANSKLHVDARWVGFPEPVTRSAGYYTPRLFFNPN